ncbi:sigma-54-dependent transcriptional regulator [Desulfatitalea tepidiphila]|uniref:sigma-54-dependent transcriptional regulator n=1 Tax=Desulfatitalea tepidiphila TaxID=1185843 RepID=UPI0006B539B1|nr:sigma-54 dependent transcriptional regulator [Desulfatitalea tepidiphila]
MEKILLIDDDEGLNHFLSRFFKRKGYDVTSCLNGRTALETIAREPFDLILLDYKMPGQNGLDILKEIKSAQVKTPVVIMTAYGNTDTAIEAMKRGAYDYLNKPFERDELSRIVAEALELNRQMKEVVCLPDPATADASSAPKGALRIVGRSRTMQAVYKIIGQIAEKDVSVLISGESGTGKELVARAIYHHSRRKDNPFMAINCAAIPEHLFESELFGYEPGAFTGAQRTKIGKIERCDGGTCFLDEIGDMSMALQAKLLRVLQEGEFERVGGKETLKVDARIIAATNKELAQEVQNGRFREDLYWRLKVITIHLPPLRKRMEDIAELVDCFVLRFSREYAKPIRLVSEEVLELFRAYPWPGNVRELENCIRRAVILCAGDIITEDHIELQAFPQAHSAQIADRDQLMARLKEKLQDVLPDILRLSEEGVHANVIDMVEETIILKALEACGNNQVRAARMLGISRNTLRHRLKKYQRKDSRQA